MRNIYTLFLCLTISFSAIAASNTPSTPTITTISPDYSKKVKVDPAFANQWRQIVYFYKKQQVNIDYSVIDRVVAVDKPDGWIGLWEMWSGTIYINVHDFPSNGKIKHDTMMLLILAHEMAHSQGFGHNFSDNTNIMYPSSQYIGDRLESGETTVTYLIMSPYRKI